MMSGRGCSRGRYLGCCGEAVKLVRKHTQENWCYDKHLVKLVYFREFCIEKNIGNPYKPYKYPIFELFHYHFWKNHHQISGKYWFSAHFDPFLNFWAKNVFFSRKNTRFFNISWYMWFWPKKVVRWKWIV